MAVFPRPGHERSSVCARRAAPYLVYTSPNIAGEITVREYEGVIAGYRFGVYCYDADVDVDLIEPDGTVWWGKCSSYEPE